MLYLSEHFHQEIRQQAIFYQRPHYIFYYIGHFLLSLQSDFVLLLLWCKDC